MGRPKLNPVEKFWKLVDKRSEDECWPWLGAFDKDGYGQIWNGYTGKMERAHRVSARLHLGDETGKVVCHKCDNPQCTNPNHLFFGTHLDNQNDKVAKQRHAKGESQGNSKLTEDDVAEIRARINEDYRTLCNDFQLAPSTVYRIWNGQSWAHSLAR